MSVSSVIKSLANGKNNVFAKVNANKGAYFKKLSNVMLNNNPIPTFNNTPKGVPNQTVNAIAAKNNLADQYSENTHANTSLRTDELKLNKPNAFVNTTRQKIIKNENSYIPPTTGAGIAPRINYTKTNVTSSVAENYKHKSTESIPSKRMHDNVKTLTGSGFIGTKETLSRIANNNIVNNSSLSNNITKNDNSNSSTLDAFNRISQVTQNLDNNRPKGSAPTVAKDNTPDLSSISTPINALVSETKEYSGKFKLLNDEQKKQTKLLEKISISLNKGGSGGLIEAAVDMFDKKRGKGLGRSVASKLGNLAKRAVPFIKKNLGGISKVARAALGSAGQIARTAATSGLASNTTMAAGRLLARATPVGMAITTGATVGGYVGSEIYKKYENTDFMKGVGEKVAKVAAFFGNDEAKQAVSDTKKYEGLGSIASKHETSGKGAGTVSTGKGDKGGVSYGSYQLSSKTGDVSNFLKKSGYDAQFSGLAPGSAAFSAKWKEVAASDPNFAKAQQKHAVSEHFDPQVNKLKKNGIDIANKGKAVQEAILSSGNQYGANSDVMVKALKGKDTKNMSQEEIVNAVQDYKASTIESRFKSSPKLWDGLRKRVETERADLLALAKAEREGKLNDPKPGEGTVLAKTSISTEKNVAMTKTSKAKETAAYSKTAKGSPLVLKEVVDNINTSKTPTTNASLENSLMPKTPSEASSLSAANKPLSNDLITALTPKPQAPSTANIKPSNSVESLATAYVSGTDIGSIQPPPVQVSSNSKGQMPTQAASTNTTIGNTVKGGSSKGVASSSNNSENKENAMMAVRNISSTIQRVFDKDFQLGV